MSRLRWEKASTRVWRAQPNDDTLCLITGGNDGSRAPRPVYEARVEWFGVAFGAHAAALGFDLAELEPLQTIAEPFPTLAEAKSWCAATAGSPR